MSPLLIMTIVLLNIFLNATYVLYFQAQPNGKVKFGAGDVKISQATVHYGILQNNLLRTRKASG
jgi:hypothetical protein